jgi:hypothetical protein
VRNLDARHRALLADESRDARQHFDVRVPVDPEIGGRDAPARLDGRGFGEHQARAAYRAAAQMHQVPIVGEAIVARILAHRRDCDAVAESHAADGQGREEIGHAIIFR